MDFEHIVSGRTKIYAILGDPVEHSLSPVIHNAAFKEKKIDNVFIALKTNLENLECAMSFIRTFDIKGLSITMPLKEAVVEYLDKLSPEAELIGAVNCIVNDNGVLTGYNTDSQGFGLSLKKNMIKPETAFVLGAGGVAKAIATSLALNNTKSIYITNRHMERAKALAERIKARSSVDINVIEWSKDRWKDYIKSSDLIINATSVGMNNKGDLSDMIPWESIQPHTVIYESIYSPFKTRFLKKAEEYQLKTIMGTELLLYQAVVAFELWTKQEPAIQIMKYAIAHFLKKSQH